MWCWLQSLSQGQASFVGSLTGSLIGLIALLIGALFNSYLNRRRDDRVRKEQSRGIATALKAEMQSICTILEINAAELREDDPLDFIVPDVANFVRVLPAVLSDLGLLDPDTIRQIIDAHIVIEQYCEHLLMRGGTLSTQNGNRRLIAMPGEKALVVAKMNETIAKRLNEVLKSLDAYV